MAGSVVPGSWKVANSKAGNKSLEQMHPILTYVDTIPNLAGINTAATSIYVRMMPLTNANPFWYWFSVFLQIWQCHGHAWML